MLNVREMHLNALERRKRAENIHAEEKCICERAKYKNVLHQRNGTEKRAKKANQFKCKFNNYLNIFAMNLQLQCANAHMLRTWRSLSRAYFRFLILSVQNG